MSTDRYLTIEEAALELAELTFDKDSLLTNMTCLGIPENSFNKMKEGVIEASQKDFKNQIMSAAKHDALVLRNPANKLPYKPTTKREFFEVISVSDVNAWLEKNGVMYRLATNNLLEVIQQKKVTTLSKTKIIAGNELEQEIFMIMLPSLNQIELLSRSQCQFEAITESTSKNEQNTESFNPLELKGIVFYAPFGKSYKDIQDQIKRMDSNKLIMIEHKTLAECVAGYFSHGEAKAANPKGIGRLERQHLQIIEHIFRAYSKSINI